MKTIVFFSAMLFLLFQSPVQSNNVSADDPDQVLFSEKEQMLFQSHLKLSADIDSFVGESYASAQYRIMAVDSAERATLSEGESVKLLLGVYQAEINFFQFVIEQSEAYRGMIKESDKKIQLSSAKFSTKKEKLSKEEKKSVQEKLSALFTKTDDSASQLNQVIDYSNNKIEKINKRLKYLNKILVKIQQ